jgi:hypothetical protein
VSWRSLSSRSFRVKLPGPSLQQLHSHSSYAYPHSSLPHAAFVSPHLPTFSTSNHQYEPPSSSLGSCMCLILLPPSSILTEAQPRDDVYGAYDHSHFQTSGPGPNQHTQSPIVTGTSVVAAKFKDGVVIAADNLGTEPPNKGHHIPCVVF